MQTQPELRRHRAEATQVARHQRAKGLGRGLRALGQRIAQVAQLGLQLRIGQAIGKRAVQLVRGEVLAGLNFPSEPWQTWLAAQREHYQLRALDALTQLREAYAARGEWAAVLELAQRQLGFEAWLEPATARL